MPAKGSAQELSLLKTTPLTHYSSASALEYFRNHLYVIGDDAPNMMVLNKEHKVVQKVKLCSCPNQQRIAREVKSDLESVVLVPRGKNNYLVGLSSFSTENRNNVVVYKPLSAAAQEPRLRTFSTSLNAAQLKQKNIEGAAWVQEKLLLGNRANDSSPDNYLLLTEFDLDAGWNGKPVQAIKLIFPETDAVIGLSGLSYVAEKDLLLITASTEKTASATADGAIGDSYLGYVEGISKKLNNTEIKVDQLFNFSRLLQQTQKIESIAVESVRGDELIVHLAADNDNGQSTLFKVRWNVAAVPTISKR